MRSEELAEMFVQCADTLVAEFDIVEFLHRLTDRCVELLGVDAAGLLLADPAGRMRVMAATSERAEALELFQIQHQEGPCLECHRDGQPVVIRDIAAVAPGRWPRFAPACRRAGFAAVHAVPMRCRDQVIGAMNLFQRDAGGLDPATARIVQAMTDIATIGLLQHRALHDQQVLIEQLQTALTSRTIIEQAKGIMAERMRLDPEQAFTVLRRHARDTNRRLTDLARTVIDGTADIRPPGPATGGIAAGS